MIEILDGLVTIADEPFTDVVLYGSTFRRWSDAEIARYHRDVRRFRRWGWLPPVLCRWLRLPAALPADRSRVISSCTVEGGHTGIRIPLGDDL